MASRRTTKHYRFGPATIARIDQIRDEQHGLTATQVLENAVELYHRSIFGRRSADMVSPRVRPGGRNGTK